MKEIKVSVIMPVYNSGEYLATAVESILNQSLREIELILVDDGSTDGSSEKCDEYALRDPRVKVIHQKNGGICAARNAALAVAKGEYIGFSDHDDEYGKGQLEDNYRAGVESGADIIKFGIREQILSRGKLIKETVRKYPKKFFSNDEIKDSFLALWREGVYECVWDALFKREFIQKNNLEFNTFFKTGSEDYDFIWHCLGCGATLQLNEGVYYTHYIRKGFSTSTKFNEHIVPTILNRLDIMFGYIPDWIDDLRKNKVEYAYFWIRLAPAAMSHVLSNPKCDMTKQEKRELLKSLKSLSSYPTFLDEVKPKEILKISSLRYAVLLWLFNRQKYSSCLNLYSLQQKIIS